MNRFVSPSEMAAAAAQEKVAAGAEPGAAAQPRPAPAELRTQPLAIPRRPAAPSGLATSPRSTWKWIGSAAEYVLLAVVGVMLLGVALLAVMPRVTPLQAYSVLSGSMRPDIPVGALIIVQRVSPDQLRVGDVISFTRPDNPAETITHRIYKISNTSAGRVYQTKGDANPLPDNWRVTLSGAGSRYWFGVPLLGYLVTYAGSAYGRLILIIIPGLILGLLYLYDIWKPSPSESTDAA
ncbi:MAG TPA: signal peptidase I [Candidatus Acidoferrales bacterium]|nr:signal peptidase I [Candidatus Acidoferrales bacterium]